MCEKRALRGEVEVDSTSIRSVRISSKSHSFKALVNQWKGDHPGRAMPSWFLLYVRVLGCVQRSTGFLACTHVHRIGLSGRLAFAPEALTLVPQGAKPPPESCAEIISSGILHRVAANAIIYTDGCRGFLAPERFKFVRLCMPVVSSPKR